MGIITSKNGASSFVVFISLIIFCRWETHICVNITLNREKLFSSFLNRIQVRFYI